MKICSRCGYQNTDDSKKCTNCLVDLHWAKVNLGTFSGTIDDTNRIGEEERRRRGTDINSANINAENENEELEYINFFTIGSALLIILDLVLLFTVSGGYAFLNILCPITFGFLAATIANLLISKRNFVAMVSLIVVLIVATVIGFMLVAAVGGFYM
jgi:hypothetical protein